MVLYVGAIDTSVVNFWVSDQGGFPRLRASLPACNGFLRSTSGATPADLLATEPFQSTYLHTYEHLQASDNF